MTMQTGKTTTTTMKAIVRSEFGSPDDVLRFSQVEKPAMGDDEVLVRVEATGIAIGDWLTVKGWPYIARPMFGVLRPKHEVPGSEVAGVVEAVGQGVKTLEPGDRVFGWGDSTLAEYVALPEASLVAAPANVTLTEAAAVPISAFTALQALRDVAMVRPGQRVLVIGASGAVGTFAVQIAKALGAEVTGVASTRNVELVRSIGADHVIDYTKQDVDETGERYDVILDMAGNRSLRSLRKALEADGTLVIVGGSGGRIAMGFGRTIRALLTSPFVGQRLAAIISSPNQEDLIVLKSMIEAGEITVVIDRTYPLDATADALTHVGSRHTRGKTVITV